MKCGLLGRKLSHSYSPRIHSMLGCYSYTLFEKEPEELETFLRQEDFSGINVTIPYKKAVIPFLDELSPAARKMGCVNTIVRRADGTLCGHNTDCFGFLSMVQRTGLSLAGKKALVLGSGGASAMAVQVLQDLGAHTTVISRTGENTYAHLEKHADASLIVNTTPVGMYPANGESPLCLDIFPNLEGVLDLIYNPARTRLLMDAENRGILRENGLWMLVAQAKESAEWFTGRNIDDSVISVIHQALSAQMQNLILVGMPGCGKSTIGPLLAQASGKTFRDSDERIVSLAGKPIPQIFAEDGEEAFRRWETAALEQLGRESGLVIATGGGCVTRERNYPLLHQNGIIVWLKRELDQLPTQGRPLSQCQSLSRMYEARAPLYRSFADIISDNSGSAEAAAQAILAQLEEYK